jgi:hypothetical protein
VERLSGREKVYTCLQRAADLESGSDQAVVSFWEVPFRVESADEWPLVMSARQGELTLVKTFAVDDGGTRLAVTYDLGGPAGLTGWLGVEWTLGLAGPEDPRLHGRWGENEGKAFRLDRVQEATAATRLDIVNEREGYGVHFAVAGECRVALYPVQTVSLAIDRMEQTYQGLAVCLLLPVHSGQCRASMVVSLESVPMR